VGRTLLVLLQGAPVGHLSEDDAGRISFRFTEEYRHLPARQILSQSFEDDLRRVYRRKDGLPAFFANLIPEGPLRDLIEEDAGISKGDDLV
jgi:serine/threonine-protein kinase HipA